MPLIIIRHGNDEDSDPTYDHDHHINRSGRKKARDKAQKLIEKYGVPDIILASPFQRGTETVSAMLSVLPEGVKISYEPMLARYFSSRERLNPQVAPTTRREKVPIQEGYQRFQHRCKKFCRLTRKYAEGKKVVWCITHALVIKEIARYYGFDIPQYLPFLYSKRCPVKHHRKEVPGL